MVAFFYDSLDRCSNTTKDCSCSRGQDEKSMKLIGTSARLER